MQVAALGNMYYVILTGEVVVVVHVRWFWGKIVLEQVKTSIKLMFKLVEYFQHYEFC